MWLWELFCLIRQCVEKGIESGEGVGRREGKDKGGGGRGGDDPQKAASLSKGKL